jgi:mRNA interferase MazF
LENIRGIPKAEESNKKHQTAMTFPRRGEIYLVEFDPARGHEIRKTRPAIIIQNDVGNRHSPVTIVAAITSKLSVTPYPVEVVVSPNTGNGLSMPSAIELSQIRSVDRERLVRRIGALDAATMRRVDEALKISLGLVNL